MKSSVKYLLSFLIPIFFLFGLSIFQNTNNQFTLYQLKPFILSLVDMVLVWILPYSPIWQKSILAALALMGVLVALKKCTTNELKYSVILLLSVVASYTIYAVAPHIGEYDYCIATILWGVAATSAFFIINSSAASSSNGSLISSVCQPSQTFIFLITTVTAIYRLYGISHLPMEQWTWELTAQQLMSSDFGEVVKGSLTDPRISPGFFWWFQSYIVAKFLGIAVFYQAWLYALISALVIPLFYWVACRFIPENAAKIATALLLASPFEAFWGSQNNAYPFFTLWFLVTIWVTDLFLSSPKKRYMFILPVVMAISNFHYPSGVLAGFLPLFVALALLFFDKQKIPTIKWVVIVIGLLLWLFLPSMIAAIYMGAWKFLSPVHLHMPFPTATSKLAVGEIDRFGFIKVVFDNIVILLRNLFIKSDGRYEFFGETALPNASALGLIASLFLALGVGLCRQWSIKAKVFIGVWFILGSAPGFLSGEFRLHRFGTIFPVFILISAVAIDYLYKTLRSRLNFDRHRRMFDAGIVLVGAVLILVNMGLYFNSINNIHRRFPEVLANTISKNIEPNTLIFLAPMHWVPLQHLTYLLFNDIEASVNNNTFFVPVWDGSETTIMPYLKNLNSVVRPDGNVFLYSGTRLKNNNIVDQIELHDKQKVMAFITTSDQFKKEVPLIESLRKNLKNYKEVSRYLCIDPANPLLPNWESLDTCPMKLTTVTGVYQRPARKVVDANDLSDVKSEGQSWKCEGCVIFQSSLSVNKVAWEGAKQLELSLKGNARYSIIFYGVEGERDVRILEARPDQENLHIFRVSLPSYKIREISIKAFPDDREYSLGHIKAIH